MFTLNSYCDVLSENAGMRNPIAGSWILVAILAAALLTLA